MRVELDAVCPCGAGANMTALPRIMIELASRRERMCAGSVSHQKETSTVHGGVP